MTPFPVGTDFSLVQPLQAEVGLFDAFRVAVQTTADPNNFLIIVVAVLFGLLMGVMPGLGGPVTLALLLPLTIEMDQLVVFMLLIAALGAGNQGGSLTSILINTPGMPPNAATLLDGYPMTRQGRAGEAIGAAATSSALGAFFGIVIILLSIPVLRPIVLSFGPAEIFWLAIWGLTTVAVVVRNDVTSGLVSAALGVLFALHGLNMMTATVRWDYGVAFLEDGFPLVSSLIGLFAIAEMIKLVSEGGSIASADSADIAGGRWTGVKSVFLHRALFLRSAVIGAVIGLIPGVGGTAANYVAYFQAVQLSTDSAGYGSGDVRGVIAPEAANDAKDGTALIPTLGLGIPGSTSMAILLGAFVMHGITPGPMLFAQELPLVAIIIVSLLVSNVLSSVVSVAAANQLVRITSIDVRIIAPLVLVIAFFGVYAAENSIYQVFVMLLFGVVGFFMIKVNMSRVPLILGIVLGGIIEQNYFRSLQVSGGDYGIFVGSPITFVLIVLTVVTLALPWIVPRVRDRSSQGALPTGSASEQVDAEPDRTDEEADPGLLPVPGHWFALAFYAGIILWVLYLLSEATSFRRPQDQLVPFMIGGVLIVLVLLKLVSILYPSIVARVTPSTDGSAATFDVETGTVVHPKAKRHRLELYMLAWSAALPVSMYLIGLGWTIPIYIFGFVWFFMGRPAFGLGLAIGTLAGVYVLFIRILDIVVWGGVLTSAMGVPDLLQLLALVV